MKHRYLLLLKLGIVLGLFIGAVNGLKTVFIQGYLHFHLYNLGAQSLALQINRWILINICFFCIFQLIAMLNSRFSVVKEKHITQISAIFISILCLFFAYNTAQASNGKISELGSNDIILRAVYCVFAIIIGFVLMKRLKNIQFNNFTMIITRLILAAKRNTHKLMYLLFVPSLVIVIAVNVTAAVFYMKATHTVKKQPNIIFIMVDTLRADHLGCYGYKSDTSPNIDRFAKNAVRFSSAISQASATAWSVPSFMTSQYPQDINSIINSKSSDETYLSDGQITLSEALKNSGYYTSAIISNPSVDASRNFSQGYDHFDDSAASVDVSSPIIFSKASKQLKMLKDKRFFMFLLFMDPHTPYIFHSPKPGNMYPPIPLLNHNENPTYRRACRLRNYYDSEIRFTDKYIGMLIKELKRQGLYDNSLIIFLADHGEELGDHGHVFHGRTLYNEVINVPLIMKTPNQNKGRVINGNARLLDVFPTIMRILGMNDSALNLQGSSMDIENLEKLNDRPIFSAIRYDNQELRSSTTEKYKYVVNMTHNKDMLFDILRDPREKNSISQKEPRICNSMRQTIIERDDFGKTLDTTSGSKAPQYTEQQKERLKSLGYL